jgi:hypothetical protein
MNKIQRTTNLLSFGKKIDRLAAVASVLCMAARAILWRVFFRGNEPV